MKKNYLIGLVLIFGLASSCVSKKKFTELETEKNSLSSQLGEAQTKVQNLTEEKTQLESTKTQLETRVNQIESDLRKTESEVSTLKKRLVSRMAKLKNSSLLKPK